ncbi:hypothetical protein K466DRAFT_579486 [Polyporus arcularius HHB13444]|uniref:RRM domain-containing protein n=1 Tax=Polyporus arcularius HHB13444 TaxID=1314778 RepID=A0A5C3PYQ7_9APHY|nr:hypothetical protein K466DRAFT_579486 [Polyporus arcularius HHB13444]
MNRHHPYGGAPYEGPRRGGGNFGPGPDRSHHYDRGGPPRGRGFGRGRGRGGGGGGGQNSYGGYGNPGPYDQGPPQGDMGGYNNYQSSPPQGQYFQNGNYNAPGPGQYNGPAGGYDQGYGNEDDWGQNYDQQGGYGNGNRFQKRHPRRERDDKVHDSIIEERLQRERPCRTLFIRNIKYETSSEDVRRLFEEHGEIKTFFDLIANRGMVFVTYYDLRAAERARDRLQGSEISGRPIDVHYSLPRDDSQGRATEKQKDQELQGNLLVTLRSSNQPIDDDEVRRKFQQFGEVKSVRPVGDRPDQRYVEFFDTRACEEAHDRLRHQGLQDGVMDIAYASPSDDPRAAAAASPRRDDRGGGFGQREWDDSHSNRGSRGGRGGRGRGRGRGGGGGGGFGGGNDWEDRSFRDRNRSYDEEFGRSQRSGGGGRGGYSGAPGPGYAGSGGGYNQPPAVPPAEAADERERLEQAKKVQQLLAALKQPQGGAPAPAPAQAAPPPVPPAPAQRMPLPPANANPYYSQPPPMQPAQVPPYSAPAPPLHHAYPGVPPQASAPNAAPAPLAGLPPNILALLQQGAQAQQPQAAPPMPPYSMPPASAMIGAQQSAGPGAAHGAPGQPGYQQLMAYLSQKR